MSSSSVDGENCWGEYSDIFPTPDTRCQKLRKKVENQRGVENQEKVKNRRGVKNHLVQLAQYPKLLSLKLVNEEFFLGKKSF